MSSIRRTQSPNSSSSRTIHFVSLGCAKNLVDTEVLLGLSERAGWTIVPDPAAAEAIVVNTCAFVGDAKEESVDTILEMAEFKQSGRCRILIMAGCLAQRYATDLTDDLPEVDHFIGTGDLLTLEQILMGEGTRLHIGRPGFLLDADTPRRLATPPYTANIKLAEGCSCGCAFCIIPKLRGPQKSRSMADIWQEVEQLKAQGVMEFNLIAQNLSAYGEDRRDGASLAKLIEHPSLAEGSHWTRLHYLYPHWVNDDLLQAMADSEAVLPYIDMPIQHIDDTILKAMRRRDDEQTTRLALERVRHHLPNAVLRSTVIVGFPGESDAQFEKLLALVEDGYFDRLGAFAYSPEEGTTAARMAGQIDEEVKAERLESLMEAQRKVSRQRLSRLKGKVVDTLIMGESAEHELLTVGRFWGQAADIDGVTYISDGEAQAGRIVPITITHTHDYDVVGKIRKRLPKGHRLGPT